VTAADRIIRWTTAGAVVGVAAIAAVASYEHASALVRAHGESGWTGTNLAAGDRVEAEHNSVRRGSLQQEIVEGTRAMVFGDADTFPVHIECMDDTQRLRAGKTIRYALVVSIETSTRIHEEISANLRQQARDRARGRVQG
jgi:hypothetical protein